MVFLSVKNGSPKALQSHLLYFQQLLLRSGSMLQKYVKRERTGNLRLHRADRAGAR